MILRVLGGCTGLCGKRLESCGLHCAQIPVSRQINVKVRPDDCNCLLAQSRDTTAGRRQWWDFGGSKPTISKQQQQQSGFDTNTNNKVDL